MRKNIEKFFIVLQYERPFPFRIFEPLNLAYDKIKIVFSHCMRDEAIEIRDSPAQFRTTGCFTTIITRAFFKRDSH